jgi:hypothetical protein
MRLSRRDDDSGKTADVRRVAGVSRYTRAERKGAASMNMKTTTTTTATTPVIRLAMRCAVLAAALVMGVAATGCEKKEPAKPNVPKPPAPDVTPKATSGGMSTTATPSSSAAGATTGTRSSPTTAPTAPASSSTTKPGAPVVVDAPLVTSTENARRSKEAQDLLDKAIKALKDSRFDDCKAALDKVDAMGSDISEATREGSKTTRKSLEAAQKLQKAPELPAGDGPNK